MEGRYHDLDERAGCARLKTAPNFVESFSLAQQLDLEEGLAIEDKAVLDQLVKWYIQTRGIELIRMRSMTRMLRGEGPGPENFHR